MSLPRALPRPGSDLRRLLTSLGLAASVFTGALLIGMLAFIIGIRLFFIGRALPGVSVAGVDVGGMRDAQIQLALDEALTYPSSGTIVLRDGQSHWSATPAELSVSMDLQTMAQQAISVGRSGGISQRLAQQLQAWYEGVNLPVQIIFDQRGGSAYLRALARQIDRPTREAELRLEGMRVVHMPGQIGRTLDIAATLADLTPSVARMHDVRLDLTVLEQPPNILDASAEAELTQALLSAPLALTAEAAEPILLQPGQVAENLSFESVEGPDGAQYELRLAPAFVRQLLGPHTEDLHRQPQNARFIFNDDTHQLDLLEPAVIGRTLDVAGTGQAIDAALNAGQHEVSLAFDTTDPDVTSEATAEDLGITENVATVATYFSGSSPERVQNIATAAGAFHGLLVAPGEVLSMADVLGDISLDKGYAEALIIYGNRTIKGVGGGVCQVSTTLFRAAFFGGFELIERHPHAYRVLYYEQGPRSPGPGLDATVYVPLVDFKFRNDTPYWLLLETYIYGNQLLWKFYSTSDGRTVEWTSSGPQNIVEAPEPLYKENPDLKKDEIKKVDFEADGMDVTVTRTVRRDGQILHDDVIKTHYLPWREVYEYGPGSELPEDAITEEDLGD